MEECPGQRDGSTIYYYEGHMYRKNRSTETSTYFRCSVRGCFGRVIQKHRLGTVQAVSPHNHESTPERHKMRRFLASMQRRVNREDRPVREIYEEEIQRFPGVDGVMPYHTMEEQLLERRRRVQNTFSGYDEYV